MRSVTPQQTVTTIIYLGVNESANWRKLDLAVLLSCIGSDDSTLSKLVLASNGLLGKLPTELGQLSSLTHLDLRKMLNLVLLLLFFMTNDHFLLVNRAVTRVK